MRHVFNVSLVIVILLLMTHSALPVSAQGNSSYGTSYVTAITYQNVGTATAEIDFTFYPSPSGQPIPIDSPDLPANAGTSLFVGSVLPSSFSRGSAVISSDQPIVATVVQLPQNNPNVRNRPLSNGFGSNDAATKVLIATVLNNVYGGTVTRFSVQNADTNPITAHVNIFPVGSSVPTRTITTTLGVGTAEFFDASLIFRDANNQPIQFNGSAVVTATGKIVATVIEESTQNPRVSAFEGIVGGSSTIYMPSALCDFGPTGQRTAYAVQNVGTTTATVTVTYRKGSAVVTPPSISILPNGKESFIACNAGVGTGYNGSAIISGTQEIVAIGKVYSNNPNYIALNTAFVGVSSGAKKLAAPYVRWALPGDFQSGSRQRAYIAIQNVGTSPSGIITVKYYDVNGNLAGTPHQVGPLDPGEKANSTPSNAGLTEFGYYGGAYGGSAIIECSAPDCKIVAVVRVASVNVPPNTANIVAEDYNAIPIN